MLILILGIWGGLVPFVGPYFHFALGPNHSWTWTSGRFWLSVLPGIVAVIGGLMLLGAGPRPSGKLGALLALAAGIWFAIGPEMSLLWNASGAQGAPHGAKGVRVLELLTYHSLLGAVMAALAGYALPGLVTRRAAAEAEAEAEPAAAGAVAGTTARPAREERVASRSNVRREPIGAENEPAVAEGVDRESTEPGAGEVPTRVAPGRDEPGAQTAVMDRSVEADAPARTEADAPARTEADAPATTDGVAETRSSAPVTTRRRQGGLLSRLRG